MVTWINCCHPLPPLIILCTSLFTNCPPSVLLYLSFCHFLHSSVPRSLLRLTLIRSFILKSDRKWWCGRWQSRRGWAAARVVRRLCCSLLKLLLAVSSGSTVLVCCRVVVCHFLAVDGSALAGLWCNGTGQNGRKRLEVPRRRKQEPGGLTRTGESASTTLD